MKQILFIFLLFLTTISRGQLIEDFSDGNLTNNPSWTGSNNSGDFTIIDNKLRSNSSAANSSFFLSSENALALNVQWEFWINLQFSTSGSNYVDIYVISDKADLKASLINGYFIRIGNTDDEISLYKRSGSTSTILKIIDGVNGSVGSTNNSLRIKLKRDQLGNFTLERETVSGASSYFNEGSVVDATHTISSHFGFLVQQSTSSFHLKHFFDDIKVTSVITDNIAPLVNSVSSIDSNTVAILFNEPMDSISVKKSSNYRLNNVDGSILNVFTTSDPARYILKLANSLISSTHTVLVTNVKDRNGNLIGQNNSGSFTYTKPYVAHYGDLVINEIFADPTPQIDLPSVEYAEIRNNTTYSIPLRNWKFNDSGSSATFGEVTIEPQSFVIICAKADTAEYKSFGKVVGLSPWPSLNNSGELLKILSPENRIIDSVLYSDTWYRSLAKKQGGWTLERKDPLSKCEGRLNWSAAVDSTGGTPGRENSIYNAGYSSTPLKPDSLKQLSDTSIIIYFNKHLDAGTISTNNFNLNPNTSQIKKITVDSDIKILTLIFDKKFQLGATYQLQMVNLRDCNGTPVSNQQENFSFKTSAPPVVAEPIDSATLIISEIFADPSPEVHLPLVEFIEAYNPSKDTIDLDKWTLSDPTTVAVIRGKKILPHEYVIFCPAADTIHYKANGKTIGLSPWPSLNNISDQIKLKSFKNRLVDSIGYSDAWYKNNSKKTGGWSIEKIDLKSVCQDFFNWTASIDTNGGTPGKQNSTNIFQYDAIALKADSLKLISDTALKLYFNKHLDGATLIAQNFQLNPEIGLNKITSDAQFKEVIITLNNKLGSGKEYQLTVTGIKDCSGNIIANQNTLRFKTDVPPVPPLELPDTSKIIITEIFADPSPEVHLPLAEFIEIYNPSGDTVNLDKWTLSDATVQGVINGKKLLPFGYAILCPIADTAHFRTFGKTIGLNPWPSLNNSSDQVVLKSTKNRLVDSIAYSDGWYKNNTKKAGGWSLEKIDIKSVCNGSFNWAASIDTNGGTPGRKNSMAISNYDTIILRVDSLKITSDTTIKLYFNKYVNGPALVFDNFKLLPATPSIKKIATAPDLKEVTLTYNMKFATGTAYEMFLSNFKNCIGNPIASDQSLKFKTDPVPTIPEIPDTAKIIITEIFADPSPEVHLPLAEFIEIHNPTKNIVDLDKWSISDAGTKGIISVQKILPGEYVILCPISDTAYYKPLGKTIGLNPWPSLNNSSDQIFLKSFKNRISDSVAYSEAWYRNVTKKQGGWSLEKMDINSVCENRFNWDASQDTSGGTPGRKNSINIPDYGALPFRADSLKLISDTSVKVYFNKHINSATLVATNFVLSQGNTIKKITSDSELKEVILAYEKKFEAGTEYLLSVSNLRDCSGKNIIDGPPLRFKILIPSPPVPEQPDTGKIFITEIFADPSPEIGLPLSEFVEIYNPGRQSINLNNWILGDSGTKGIIRNSIIGPGEYLIFCPVADTLEFQKFGKTKGIIAWPALGNSGDQVTLRSAKKRLVDSVGYSDKWYKNAIKKNGGWSLEKINIINTSCNGFYNWASSTDKLGGTPGRQNSIAVPVNEFKVDSLRHTSDSTVILYLNSIPDTTYLKASNFKIDNQIGKAIGISVQDDYKTMYLKFASKFREGTTYLVIVDSLFECGGKIISPANNNNHFTIPIIAEQVYPIIINEIMADPSPQVQLPETEYVELYNASEKAVSLKGMVYGDESRKYKFNSGEIGPKSYLILCAEKDTLEFQKFGKVFGLPVWPALGNEKDVLFLKNNKGKEFQRISYDNSWYKDTKKKGGGYSLERISDISVCKEFQNWAGSQDPTGGTPGKQNSIFTDSLNNGLKLTDAILTDSVSLTLTFNKSVDSLSASLPDNFQLNNGVGKPASVIPLAPLFEQVLLKFSKPLARGHVYKINVINLRDCAGSTVLVNFEHKEFTLAEKILKNDLLVNEVLFNPRPGGVDFVEIYNNSKHTLDLQDLSIATVSNDTISNAKRISLKQLLFDPGQYILLTNDPENIKKEYSVLNPQSLLKIVLPQFNDDKGTVVLMSDGSRIDQLDYNEKMHFQLLKNLEGVSLERSTFKLNTNAPGNFRSATAAAGFGTPGYKNSQYSDITISNQEFALLSRTFSPDNDGFEDLLQVSYQMPVPGMVANMKIFNDKGVLIKNLLKNFTLSSTGLISWDGLSEFGSAAATGIYYLYAEIFNTSGNVKKFRRSFVLAKKL